MFQKQIDNFLLTHNRGLFIVDEESREVIYADELIHEYFGENILGRPCYEALCGRTAPCLACPSLTLSDKGPAFWEITRRGHLREMYLVSGALFEEGGRLYRIGRIFNISDYMQLSKEAIAYTEELRKREIRKGETDALTGLDNRNRYANRLAGEYKGKTNWGVLYMDINNMKKTNDLLGHETGDILLRKAAASIFAVLSRDVHGYRVGGDEFIIVIPECSQARLDQVHRYWLRACEEINETGDDVLCSIAAGKALGAPGEALDAVVKRADAAMYVEKQALKEALGEKPER